MKLSTILFAATIILNHAIFAEQSADVPQLKALNEGWTSERERVLRPVDAKYETALRRLKDQLTKSGDLYGALTVDKEIKEVGLLLVEWTTKLSSIKPKKSEVGWGEFLSGKISNQFDLDGRPLQVQGLDVDDGFFAHAPSRLVFDLKGKDYKALRGSVALADRHVDGYNGSVSFRILGDGKEIWKSETISPEKGSSQTAKYEVNIVGVSELELVVDDLGYYGYDASVWIAPELGK